ncbi:hypothetical protein HWQ46_09350 [Shewanella sp. D64]|uniref:hypothetical protein n=1 Tax=unclassified Shewanella TaxID=196818 RepID=UPI0022BA6305|nr:MULTISPECIES: hypothetical protein [unclassified Shewanella]MEC4725747.1 hypothetical protein [Shewanella sp. D64]MEC4737646.1 hypothetical protein [Shewanella sp. E94]WBJ93455.1 hypothetical protein HWQ47_16135 [Shewanella sp. MTB7]
MLTLETMIEKTCLIGLTYFTAEGEMLKQSLLAGKVTSYDADKGIMIALFEQLKSEGRDKQVNSNKNTPTSVKEFLIPTDLTCWFNAPKGQFHTSVEGLTVTNPDYLITWDIYQSRSYKQQTDKIHKHVSDEQMQWWEWKPRVQQPAVS